MNLQDGQVWVSALTGTKRTVIRARCTISGHAPLGHWSYLKYRQGHVVRVIFRHSFEYWINYNEATVEAP